MEALYIKLLPVQSLLVLKLSTAFDVNEGDSCACFGSVTSPKRSKGGRLFLVPSLACWKPLWCDPWRRSSRSSGDVPRVVSISRNAKELRWRGEEVVELFKEVIRR
jgi:hypothetical protein